MTTPIASSLDNEMPRSDVSSAGQTPNTNTQRLRVATPLSGAPDFMGDLFHAQQALITAQYTFIADANVTALLAAQRDHIFAQTEVLRRLAVFG